MTTSGQTDPPSTAPSTHRLTSNLRQRSSLSSKPALPAHWKYTQYMHTCPLTGSSALSKTSPFYSIFYKHKHVQSSGCLGRILQSEGRHLTLALTLSRSFIGSPYWSAEEMARRVCSFTHSMWPGVHTHAVCIHAESLSSVQTKRPSQTPEIGCRCASRRHHNVHRVLMQSHKPRQ
jgi:hypothetical protein